MKPVIGITTAHSTNDNRFFASNDYICSIIENEGIPILLPPCKKEDIKKQLSTIDGLLLTGGGDINPLLLGQQPEPNIGESSLVRDKYELELTKIAIELKIPILGICRGIQIIAAATGGTLLQDISNITSVSHNQKSSRYEETHSIYVARNSILHGVLGVTEAHVNSLHHQAVSSVGQNFLVSARSKDGIIEAIESQNGFIVGVQWHAENLYRHKEEQRNLFKAFIKEALS